MYTWKKKIKGNFRMKDEQIERRLKELKKLGYIVPNMKILKTRAQLDDIKASGDINSAVLDYVVSKVEIGMSTEEIDDMVFAKTKELGGIPGTLNYEGFPKSSCISINDQICHGIPSKNDILKDGDIVNIDITTIYNGYYSDSSRMVMLGNVKEETKKLVQVAKECIEEGLKEVKPWGFLGDMGHAVNEHAKKNGFSVVREIGGHGVGFAMHEDPFVSYVAKKGTEMVMVPGMVFTIEPMINMGTCRIRMDRQNGWTIYTKDGLPSAQWEVTVAITEDGYEILAH